MTFLTVVGGIVITLLLLYLTLAYISMFLVSDETIWFSFRNYPVAMTLWMLVGGVLIGGWVLWWIYIASHISIGVS